VAYSYGLDSVARLTVYYRLHGQICLNQMDFLVVEVPTTPVNSGAESLVTAAEGGGLRDMISLLSDELEVGGATVRAIDDPLSWVEEFPLSIETGGATGQALPSHDAVVVRKIAEHAGRSSRGRIFLPGIREEDTEESLISVDLRNGLTVAANGLMSLDIVDNGWTFHGVITNGPLGDPFATRIIAACSVDRIVHTQRRRTPGIGI